MERRGGRDWGEVPLGKWVGGEERLLSQIKEREKKQGPEAMQRGRGHSRECSWGEGEETACVQLHREGT